MIDADTVCGAAVVRCSSRCSFRQTEAQRADPGLGLWPRARSDRHAHYACRAGLELERSSPDGARARMPAGPPEVQARESSSRLSRRGAGSNRRRAPRAGPARARHDVGLVQVDAAAIRHHLSEPVDPSHLSLFRDFFFSSMVARFEALTRRLYRRFPAPPPSWGGQHPRKVVSSSPLAPSTPVERSRRSVHDFTLHTSPLHSPRRRRFSYPDVPILSGATRQERRADHNGLPNV